MLWEVVQYRLIFVLLEEASAMVFLGQSRNFGPRYYLAGELRELECTPQCRESPVDSCGSGLLVSARADVPRN